MSTRKYVCKLQLQELYCSSFTLRDPRDHVTITGQPTYHNIPLLKLFGCLKEFMLVQVKTGTRS